MPGMPYHQSPYDREREEREHAEKMAALRKAEHDKLLAWRHRKLVIAGFTEAVADLILSWEPNPVGAAPIYQEALRLRAKGCPTDVALDLLRPDVLPASEEGSR